MPASSQAPLTGHAADVISRPEGTRPRSTDPNPLILAPVPPNSTIKIAEIIQALVANALLDVTESLIIDDPNAHPIENDGTGIIYPGRYNGSEVAIKCYRFFLSSNSSSRNLLQRAARELQVWAQVKHENILPLLGVARFKDQTALIFPWMKEGSIVDFRNRTTSFDWSKMCLQIASGVSFLHNKNIVHGDLRGKHVLVSEDDTVKITGFGAPVLKALSAKFLSKDTASMSIRWAAPEILSGTVEASTAADVYALGMTILEVVSGEVPFAGKQTHEVISEVAFHHAIPNRPAMQFPDDPVFNQLWVLLTKCWDKTPDLRPQANEVYTTLRTIMQGTGFDP